MSGLTVLRKSLREELLQPHCGENRIFRQITEMERIRRRIEMTMATRRIRTVRYRTSSTLAFCDECGEDKLSYSPGQIAALLRIPLHEVCLNIAVGKFHLTTKHRGSAFVCIESLNIPRDEGAYPVNI